MHRMLYVKLMVTTNQKLVTDMQKIKRKKSKHISKESHETTREQSKKEGNKEEL